MTKNFQTQSDHKILIEPSFLVTKTKQHEIGFKNKEKCVVAKMK